MLCEPQQPTHEAARCAVESSSELWVTRHSNGSHVYSGEFERDWVYRALKC